MQSRQQVNALPVVCVVGDRGSDEGAGIADNHRQRPKPSANSSSIRSEVSGRPDRTAPNHGGGHTGVSEVPTKRCTSTSATDTRSSGSSSTRRRSSSRAVMGKSYVRWGAAGSRPRQVGAALYSFRARFACWVEFTQLTDVGADAQGGYAVATDVEQHA